MPDYPPGTPSWVDLNSPDPDASAAFYRDLFGWEAVEVGDPEETQGYRQFQLDGKSVAGLSPLWGDAPMPPHWATYISVESADETAGKIKDAGGQLFMDPFDVMDAGRMAVFADPTGAACGIWEPNQHRGAELVNRVGTLGWNELQTRDAEKAKEFYPAVFGWNPTPSQNMETYTTWELDGRPIGGLIQMDENFPPDVPSNWMPYFGIEDTDASVATAQGNGAGVAVPPTDIPNMGRFAVLTDPQGAVFALMAMSQEVRERGEQQAAQLGA